MTQAPLGWSEVTLGCLTRSDSPICYGVLKPGDPDPEGVPMVRVTDIRTNEFDSSRVAYITPELDAEFSRSRVVPGDVLISVQGTVGRVAIVPTSFPGGNISRTIARIRLADPSLSRWVHGALLAPEQQAKIDSDTGGTTRDSLNIGDLREITVPLAPANEQRRIVTKIDSLSTKSKSARDHLDRGMGLVGRYKETLLSSVLSGLNAPKELKLAQICRSISDGDHQAPPKSEGGVPFITISALNDGIIRLDKATRHVPLSYYNGLKSARVPKSGDVLFSVTGSIGFSALVASDEPFVFQRHIAILKSNPEIIRSEFLLVNLRSMSVKQQMLACATGTAQLTVPLSGLRSFSIPLPSLQEQDLAVERIKKAFAWIDRLTSEAASARKLIDHLDQAILSKAFRGELVPQDPDDEPASMLLERIKAECAGATPARRGRGRPRLATT